MHMWNCAHFSHLWRAKLAEVFSRNWKRCFRSHPRIWVVLSLHSGFPPAAQKPKRWSLQKKKKKKKKLEQATWGFGGLPKREVTAESSRLFVGRQRTGAESALINTSMHLPLNQNPRVSERSQATIINIILNKFTLKSPSVSFRKQWTPAYMPRHNAIVRIRIRIRIIQYYFHFYIIKTKIVNSRLLWLSFHSCCAAFCCACILSVRIGPSPSGARGGDPALRAVIGAKSETPLRESRSLDSHVPGRGRRVPVQTSIICANALSSPHSSLRPQPPGAAAAFPPSWFRPLPLSRRLL